MKQAVKITRKDKSTHSIALQAIEIVLDQCYASQQEQHDLTVGQEIAALEALNQAVAAQWPLPEEVTARINLGPVAARNIADWNPALADSLMKLDYGLRLDTETLTQLVQTVPSMAYAKATVPLSNMFGYATAMRGSTQGRANFSMEFKQYEEAPRSVSEEIIAKVQGAKDK